MNYEDEKLSDGNAATIKQEPSMPPESQASTTREITPLTAVQEITEWPESVHQQVSQAEKSRLAALQRSALNANQRRRRLRQGLLSLLVILIAGTASLFLWRRLGRDNAAVSPSPTPVVAASPSSDLQNTQLSVNPTDNGEYYKRTEASVTDEGQEILKVIQYDFYASRFIVNNTTLRNERGLVSALTGLYEQQANSWVLIFATTSLEGYEDYNMVLCRRRLYAVRDLLSREAEISPRGGYWGILANEFDPAELATTSRELREDEENRIARERGPVWLSDQRKLIVITIRETSPLSDKARKQVPLVVARHVYEKGMIPRNYDASGSTPFMLNKNPDGGENARRNDE
jgi:hypothetical protein